jgi:LysR family transcriptional regulator of gallate degradation
MTDRYSALVQWQRLRAFAAVAEHGNVHRAGAALHLSQPAVTRSVRHLEAALGVALFERTSRGMHPTPAGRAVYRRAKGALAALSRAGAAVLECGAGPSVPPARERLSAAVTQGMLASLMAVARSGSEAAGAALINLSQPAVNRHLRRLEHAAAVPLFARSARGTHLTDAGELLLRQAKLALAEMRVAAEELASLQGELDGHIVIGALPLSSGHLVPLAVDRTLRDHPGLRISIVDGTYETLSQGLQCADVSLIVGALRCARDEPYAIHEPLFEDSLSVVARTDHPVLRLLRQGAATSPGELADLANEAWIVPLPGTPARAAFERAFRAAAVEPPRAQLQGNSPAIVRSLLLSSDRLALLSPRQVRQELCQGILSVVPVTVTQTRRTIGLARLRCSEPSPGLAVLLEAFRELSRD